MPSIDGDSDVNGFSTIQPSWYVLLSGTCHSDDLSIAPSRGEEHDVHDTISLYKV